MLTRFLTRIFFPILPILYVTGIFLLPRMIPSSLIAKVWNPYSLLHIPIYGVLMVLLILSFGINLINPRLVSPIFSSFFLPGGIATMVGIFDEINQMNIPGREASVTDVILDICGIILACILIKIWRNKNVFKIDSSRRSNRP